MKHGPFCCNRREFLRLGAAVAAGIPLVRAAETTPTPRNAKVAIAACRGYGAEVRTALAECFDALGGIGGLVKNKTVTVKINLTGTDFKPFFGRPVGETYMTHPATAMALTQLLFAAGARRVRFVESTSALPALEQAVTAAGWDVKAFRAAGNVEFEDTRNLGQGKDYATFKVPGGGHFFSRFELNHSYADTDVMVSLCKLKQHMTTGVTLTMKNLFGITPNSLYGTEAPNEDALKGRDRLHDINSTEPRANPLPYDPPGATDEFTKPGDGGTRIPRIITELCSVRPIHLGIIDGITSVSGGEGFWNTADRPMHPTNPGVLIAGMNPVATDAVGTAVMGFDPRALRGSKLFFNCDNHLLLAEQAGLGTADLSRIEVVGLPIAQARSSQYAL